MTTHRPLPPAIRDQLILTGKTTTTRLTEHTQTRTCPTCHHHVLAALIDGGTFHADPTPLNPEGELLAQLADRTTFRHIADFLTARTSHDITRTPAGTDPQADIIPEHQCGSPPLPSAPSVHHTNKPRPRLTGPPPF